MAVKDGILATLRPAMFVHQGEYDALDFRRVLSRMRPPVFGVVGDGFKVSRVNAQTARVRVAGVSDAWVGFNSGTGEAVSSRDGAFVSLDDPVEFDVPVPSVGEQRTYYVVLKVEERDGDDAVSYAAGDQFEPYSLDDFAAGWGFTLVAGPNGGAVPADSLVPQNSLVLASVTVKGGQVLDDTSIKDLRFSYGSQNDAAHVSILRTAQGRTVADVAKNKPTIRNGSLIYDVADDTLHYAVSGGTGKTRPVERGTQFYQARGSGTPGLAGGNNAKGFGILKIWIPRADYPRVVQLFCSIRGDLKTSPNEPHMMSWSLRGSGNTNAEVGTLTYTETMSAHTGQWGWQGNYVETLDAGVGKDFWVSARPRTGKAVYANGGDARIWAVVTPLIN
ncbi:hypothetical protein [Streptomyces bacillaris]